MAAGAAVCAHCPSSHSTHNRSGLSLASLTSATQTAISEATVSFTFAFMRILYFFHPPLYLSSFPSFSLPLVVTRYSLAWFSPLSLPLTFLHNNTCHFSHNKTGLLRPDPWPPAPPRLSLSLSAWPPWSQALSASPGVEFLGWPRDFQCWPGTFHHPPQPPTPTLYHTLPTMVIRKHTPVSLDVMLLGMTIQDLHILKSSTTNYRYVGSR